MNIEAAFIQAVQTAIGLIFMVSSVAKAREMGRFVDGVVSYHVLPKRLATLYAVLLPPLEAAVGIALLVGLFVDVCALIAAAMLVSFSMAIAINLRRKRQLPCYCFGGGSSEQLSPRSLWRVVLLLLGVGCILSPRFLGVVAPELLAFGEPGWVVDTVLRTTLTLFILAAGTWILWTPTIFRPWIDSVRAQLAHASVAHVVLRKSHAE
ncbi:MAG: MauE/DoxX family redox-associated membrane protein [Chloroflexota bacterium]